MPIFIISLESAVKRFTKSQQEGSRASKGAVREEVGEEVRQLQAAVSRAVKANKTLMYKPH